MYIGSISVIKDTGTEITCHDSANIRQFKIALDRRNQQKAHVPRILPTPSAQDTKIGQRSTLTALKTSVSCVVLDCWLVETRKSRWVQYLSLVLPETDVKLTGLGRRCQNYGE